MAEPGSTTALTIRDVCAHLDGRQILYDITLAAERGTITAILGPNGAGKTTLLECVAGLLPCTGAIRVDGVDVDTLSRRERARMVAYVPQRSALDAPLSAATVVGHGRYAHSGSSFATGEHRLAVERAMEATDITEFARRSYLDLSAGEQRRVLIARALATGAEILLLDEPTASLDISHALALFRLIRQLSASGTCVIVVLHDLNDALTYTDRAVLLDRGRVATAGRTDEVVTESPIRRVYGVEPLNGSGLFFRLPES